MGNFWRNSALFPAVLLAGCGLFPIEPQEPPVPEVVVIEPECPAVEIPECPEPEVVEKIVVKTVAAKLPPMATTAGKLHLPIIGGVETASVDPSGLVMEARIDTGAETTSIHAEDIRLVERDGKRYVLFSLISPATGDKVPMERRLRRRVRIKQQDTEGESRYVVRLWVTVGKTHSRIDVSLTNRENFEFPLLIGRNFLTDAAIVDVSRKHLAGPPLTEGDG